MGRARRIWPDQRSVLRDGAHSGELSAADPGETRIPNGLTPAATLSKGIPAVQVPGRRQRRPATSRVTTRGRATRRNSIADTSSRGTSPSSASCRGTSRDKSATSPRARRGSSDSSTSTPARSLAPARTAGRSSRIRPNRVDRAAAAGRRWQVRLDAVAVAAPLLDGLSLGVNYTLGQGDQPERKQLLARRRSRVQALAYLDRNLRAHEQRIDGTTSGSRMSGRFPSARPPVAERRRRALVRFSAAGRSTT